MCPQGETYTQSKAEELLKEEHLVFICGHYEGYDERIREHLVTDEISIGDYVLTGGELPAMAVIDSVVRLLPGVLGNENSAVTDSFSTGLLEYPHYTRPAVFRGWEVPDVLHIRSSCECRGLAARAIASAHPGAPSGAAGRS